jgi:hypothetical protein
MPVSLGHFENNYEPPRPAINQPGYKTTPAKPGDESRIHPALSRSRGNSSPGGPKADCQINLEMINNGRCVAGGSTPGGDGGDLKFLGGNDTRMTRQ